MSRFTIFVGGIHGSGKSHFCKLLQEEIVCDYISASTILQWSTKDKTVKNIEANQEALSLLIPYAIQGDKTFVIDGHFVLWNKQRAVEEVPITFFEACKPNVIVVIKESPAIIVERLFRRDGMPYKTDEIEELQKKEIDNARVTSDKLGIPMFILQSTDDEGIKSCIIDVKNIMAEYTRENISSPMLKTVIIRFDYAGGTDITRFVDEIKQQNYIQEAFGALHRIDTPQYSITLNARDNGTSILPFAETQKATIYRFSEGKYDEGLNVILDVTAESVCLAIDCRKNYRGSGRYTELMGKLISKLKDLDSFISVRRIGIRKIDAQVIEEGEKISDYFNENYVASRSWYSSPKERVNYADFFTIGRVNFNVVQHISRNSIGKTQAIFDVDSFIVNEELNSLISNEKVLVDFMNNEMQDKMFELFVSCASKEYLEKCKQAKTNK